MARLATVHFIFEKRQLMPLFPFFISTWNILCQVHITSQTEQLIPFGVGVASDPMALRRGGKKLAMEDVYYYQWPLPGADQVLELFLFISVNILHIFFKEWHSLNMPTLQFGLFGICDGHGGAEAAKSASKLVLNSNGLPFLVSELCNLCWKTG